MVEGDYRQYGYQHNQGPSTLRNSWKHSVRRTAGRTAGRRSGLRDGHRRGRTGIRACVQPKDNDVDGRLGLKVADPRIYIGVGYLARWGDYGYPRQNGIGFGLEKLPDLNQPFSVFGSAYYYPNIKGTCDVSACPGGPFDLEYRILRYEIGADATASKARRSSSKAAGLATADATSRMPRPTSRITRDSWASASTSRLGPRGNRAARGNPGPLCTWRLRARPIRCRITPWRRISPGALRGAFSRTAGAGPVRRGPV